MGILGCIKALLLLSSFVRELIRFSNNWAFLKMSIADEYEIVNWEIDIMMRMIWKLTEKISQVMCNSCRNCTLFCYK